MKWPCSVGDLQKGERYNVMIYNYLQQGQANIYIYRYININYLFWSSLAKHTTADIVVSYDIACQWSTNIWAQFVRYNFIFDPTKCVFVFLMPKFHLPAHQQACQVGYLFNYTKQVGRTDGKAIEHSWSATNLFTSSTKEMGLGS